jgi:2-methylcitrate dehydratase PrpD
MTIEAQLVENVLSKNFADYDSEDLRYAKHRITDTIGALIGGVHASGADMMLEIVKGWGGTEESTILGIGEKVPAANAVLAMGIMARANDFEPAGGPEIAGRKSPGHYSATSVPVAFAIAEKLGLGGKDLINALILGDDLGSRIGTAGAASFDAGWDPAGTCSRFASTAITGKLIDLNKDQMLNALGIALTQVAGTMLPVYDYTHSFNLSQGLAGWNGILSVELAQRGFTGPKDFLFGNFGYYQQFGHDVDPGILTGDLGKKFYSDEEFKLFPCCRGIASPIETALKLVKENDINPEEIKDIQIDLPPKSKTSFLIQPFRTGPSLKATAILNTTFNVANVFLRGDVGLGHYRDEAILDSRIKNLTDKIRINTTASGEKFYCEITVKMGDGSVFSAITEEPRGDYRNKPITKGEIREKFFASAAFSGAISLEQAERALDLLDRLETLDSLTELINVLTPEAKLS